MTSTEIRQSFLDFFTQKEHTIVPSAPLLPQSPGLLFTNAGMNQFVPYFLGTENAPYSPPRATDTQKCIRAGGKHNDLEDVGYDTYHHTFFEMLGNWSFGNYFKKEAIEWAWELTTKVWKFPADRLYATVYAPAEGDPSEFDQEAYDFWKTLFIAEGLDPEKHIVNGNVKDNFWMMGETGPCGPCSELHMDLTPDKTGGSLVNGDSDKCIEIWNLVFIQFNAEADGSFRDLPAKHVDTGMGFERVCSIMQNTDGLTNFNKRISNYATDVFSPIFQKLEEMSGKTYVDIYPHDEGAQNDPEVLEQAIAFRVIADHLRTLSLSIADGIQPGNNGRNYVLRRILRRAVRYGRALGFSGETLFMGQLVDTLADQLTIFPELGEKRAMVKETLEREEKSFNKTLDRGLSLFAKASGSLKGGDTFPGDVAYDLFSTYGFPTDLTELLIRENGFKWDQGAFEKAETDHKATGKQGEQKTIVRAVDISTEAVTEFIGFDAVSSPAKVLEVISREEGTFVITDKSPFYVEKGGQVGDTGVLGGHPVDSVMQVGDAIVHVLEAGAEVEEGSAVILSVNLEKRAAISAHHTATHLLHWALHEHVSKEASQAGSMVSADRLRFDFNSDALTKDQIETLEKAVNDKIAEGGTVSWKEVKHADIKDRADIMQFFGDKYGENVRVVQIGGEAQELNGYSMELCGGTHVGNTRELGHFIIKKEEAIASGVRRMEAACGEAAKDYIKDELKAASEKTVEYIGKSLSTLGIFSKLKKTKKVIEDAASPLKEFEDFFSEKVSSNIDVDRIKKAFKDTLETDAKPENLFEELKESVTLPEFDLPKPLADLGQKLEDQRVNLEKIIKKATAANAAQHADELLTTELNADGHTVLSLEGDPSLLQELLNGFKKRQYPYAAFLIVNDGSKLHLGAYAGDSAQSAGLMAGKLIQTLAPIAGGKGGGKPDQARGAAPELEKAGELEEKAKEMLG